LAGCYPPDRDTQAQSAGIPVPAAALSLPVGGTLSVKVFLDDEASPRFNNEDVDPGSANITLEFASPEGVHTFTVLFEYYDPEFVREDARPWELARWNSGPVEVTAGESLSLNVSDSDYVYADSDDDGLSNAVELNDRTDPGNPDDPGDPNDPMIIPPDGLWRGETQDQTITDVLAILSGGRILVIAGELIYNGSYIATYQGSYTGSVDVYSRVGEKLTALAQVVASGTRLSQSVLTLNVDAVGTSIAARTFAFTLDASYERDSALALIAKTWSTTIDDPSYTLTFPIDSNGILTGASDTDGCLYSGSLALLDSRYNLYQAALSLDDQTQDACAPFTGPGYTGFASLTPDDDSLVIMVSNEAHALSFELARSGSPSKGKPKKPRATP
jgi:hypothetical protein